MNMGVCPVSTLPVFMGHEHERLSTLPVFTGRKHGCHFRREHGPGTRIMNTGSV